MLDRLGPDKASLQVHLTLKKDDWLLLVPSDIHCSYNTLLAMERLCICEVASSYRRIVSIDVSSFLNIAKKQSRYLDGSKVLYVIHF